MHNYILLMKSIFAASLFLLFGVQSSLSEQLSANGPETPSIPGWNALVEELEGLPAILLNKLPESMRNDPRIQQEVGRLILQALTVSSIEALGSDGNYPVFLPGIGQLLNVGQPNADTLYKTASITPGGVYRVRGNKGSLEIAVLGQMGPTPSDSENGGSQPGPARTHLDLDTLSTDEDGNFDLLLSPTRPENHSGDWWKTNPSSFRLMLRQVSSDWEKQKDPEISIERIDKPAEKPRPTARELEQRLHRLPQATAFMATLFIDKVERLRGQGYVNELKVFDVSQMGGLEGQFYYEGPYELTATEALIIEAKHPEKCRYRSILLTNEIYQTTDWYNNHSSLNASQATLDSDGVLRVVVSEEDPGVPNWLDTAGYPRGLVQGRWTHCDSQPVPTVKKVQVRDVRKHLPLETPSMSPEERDSTIRERRAAYQKRRHW
ncbi:DUF1214 domain-containing protein [Myxococcota bacterium]|nr:DUF1214 domain-containing protein [Myxococcota bacterium]